MTQHEEQPVLLTMRIKTAKWENLKKPNDVLFVSEWRSHEDMHKFGEEHGDKFNEIAGVNPDDWEDVAWKLTGPQAFERSGSITLTQGG